MDTLEWDEPVGILCNSVLACTALATILIFGRRVIRHWRFLRREWFHFEVLTKPRQTLDKLFCQAAWVGWSEEEVADANRLSRFIRVEINARRSAYAKRASGTGACLMCGMTLVGFANSFLNTTMQTPDIGQELSFLACFLFALLVNSYRKLREGFLLHVSHCFFMAIFFVHSITVTEARLKHYNTWRTIFCVARLCAGLFSLDITVSFWTNLLFTVGVVINAFCHDWHASNRLSTVHEEILVCFCIFILLCIIENSMVASATQHVKVQSMQEERSAITSLLNIVCDAVVELDENLCLVGECLPLSNVLLRNGGRKLNGVPLKQLVMPEDQARFEEALALESTTAGANMFHVRLRDSWDNAAAMELFHVAFVTKGNELRRLIGLREYSDTQNDTHDLSSNIFNSRDSTAREVAPARSPFTGRHQRHSTSRRSTTSQNNSGNSFTSDDDADALQVDVTADEGLPVTYVSTKFHRRYGTPNTLAEALIDPKDFVDWVREKSEAIISGSIPPQVLGYGTLSMGNASNPHYRSAMVFFPDPPTCQPQEEPSKVLDLDSTASVYRISIRLHGRQSAPSASSASISSASTFGGTCPQPQRLSLAGQDEHGNKAFQVQGQVTDYSIFENRSRGPIAEAVHDRAITPI